MLRIEQPFNDDGRPIPRRTPVSVPFFDAAREGRLRIPKCPRKGFFFYPRSRCACCLKDDWTWEDASGRGLNSYSPFAPEWRPKNAIIRRDGKTADACSTRTD